MDIVLGVSMTPTTVRMVLVEGENADGSIVDHDVFDICADEGAANSSPTQQVIAAIVGTRESANAGGHRLISTGVVWSERTDAAMLRHELDVRGIERVVLVSQLHSAQALAKAVGRAVDYDKTGLLFVEGDTATLSVVHTDDGSIVKVETRSLRSANALAVLTEMVTSLEEGSSRPDGIYLLGSGLDLNSVREHLESQVTIPLSAPEEPEMALARGAALASATAPEFDPLTVGIAYSQDLDGLTDAYSADVGGAVGSTGASLGDYMADSRAGRQPFLLVGSSMTAIFVVGVVALVISLAISIRPAVDTRPEPGAGVVPPTVAPPARPAVPNPPNAQPAPAQPPSAAPPPAPVTIPEPPPVVQQVPEVVQPPARSAPVPAAVPPPAPAAPPPAPVIQPPTIQLAPGLILTFPPFIGPGPGPVYQPPMRQYGPGWPRHGRHGGDD